MDGHGSHRHGRIREVPAVPWGTDDLVDVIRRAAAGEEIFPAPQLRLLTLAPGTGETEAKVKLTHRELEVLQGLVDGMSTDELATALFVSPRTVQGHVQSILTKLRVRSKLVGT